MCKVLFVKKKIGEKVIISLKLDCVPRLRLKLLN